MKNLCARYFAISFNRCNGGGCVHIAFIAHLWVYTEGTILNCSELQYRLSLSCFRLINEVADLSASKYNLPLNWELTILLKRLD